MCVDRGSLENTPIHTQNIIRYVKLFIFSIKLEDTKCAHKRSTKLQTRGCRRYESVIWNSMIQVAGSG